MKISSKFFIASFVFLLIFMAYAFFTFFSSETNVEGLIYMAASCGGIGGLLTHIGIIHHREGK